MILNFNVDTLYIPCVNSSCFSLLWLDRVRDLQDFFSAYKVLIIKYLLSCFKSLRQLVYRSGNQNTELQATRILIKSNQNTELRQLIYRLGNQNTDL